MLAGAALILVGTAFLDYYEGVGGGFGGDQRSSAGIGTGIVFAMVPALLGLCLIRWTRTAWLGIAAIVIGVLTLVIQYLYMAVAVWVAGASHDAYLEPELGFWVSLSACGPIVLGGIVQLVRAALPQRNDR